MFIRYSIPAYVLMDREPAWVGWAELGLARVRPSRWQVFEITSDLPSVFRTRKKALVFAGSPKGQIDRPNIDLGPVFKGVKRGRKIFNLSPTLHHLNKKSNWKWQKALLWCQMDNRHFFLCVSNLSRAKPICSIFLITKQWPIIEFWGLKVNMCEVKYWQIR